MTLDEEYELRALGLKWLEKARRHADDSKKIGHSGTFLGNEDLSLSGEDLDMVGDLVKFLEKYGMAERVEYFKNLWNGEK